MSSSVLYLLILHCMFFFTLTAGSSVIYSCSQLFLAEGQHMEGRGSGVGTVRVGMSSSRYGRGIIHVTGCHEVTPTTYVYNVLTRMWADRC